MREQCQNVVGLEKKIIGAQAPPPKAYAFELEARPGKGEETRGGGGVDS